MNGSDDLDDLHEGGWTARALDLLAARVDAIRADLNVLMGRARPDHDPSTGEPRLGGIGIGTWIAIFATIVVPLIGTAALVVLHNP